LEFESQKDKGLKVTTPVSTGVFCFLYKLQLMPGEPASDNYIFFDLQITRPSWFLYILACFINFVPGKPGDMLEIARNVRQPTTPEERPPSPS